MNNNELLVTIQCLVYNHEPYLRQCLDGFVMQKTNFKFEAIVHDDVSTDGSAAIIREYAERYPDIIKPIFETENQYSKHDGSLDRIMHEACKGKYIALCEGDDYWIDPLKLQKQVNFMEKNNAYTLIGSNARIQTNNNKFIGLFCTYNSRNIGIAEIIRSWSFPTAGMLYRSSICKHIPIIKDAPQGDILIQLTCAHYGKCYYDKDVMCVYRWLTPGSSTERVRKDQLNYYVKHYSMWVVINECFNGKYNEYIQPKLKQIKKQIFRERLFKFIPGLQILRAFYRSLRGY